MAKKMTKKHVSHRFFMKRTFEVKIRAHLRKFTLFARTVLILNT